MSSHRPNMNPASSSSTGGGKNAGGSSGAAGPSSGGTNNNNPANINQQEQQLKLAFSEIRDVPTGALGLFRLNPEQCGFKNVLTNKIQSFFFRDLLERPEVTQVSGRSFLLKFVTKKNIFRYDGFKKEDILNIESILSSHVFHREMVHKAAPLLADELLAKEDESDSSSDDERSPSPKLNKRIAGLSNRLLATRGGNWGDLDLLGDDELEYSLRNENDEQVLHLVARDVSQVTNPNRNEVHVELEDPFGLDENEALRADQGSSRTGAELLTEVRFYIEPERGDGDLDPGDDDASNVGGRNKRGGNKKKNANEFEDQTRAEKLRSAMITGLDLEMDVSETVCEVPDLKWAVPALRGSLKFHSNGFSLHGKSSDFMIRYSTLRKLFVLQGLRNDMHLVFQLSMPIRHGSQEHHFICMQSEALSLPTPDAMELNNIKEVELKKHNLNREPTTGKRSLLLYEFLSRLFTMLSDVTLTLALDTYMSARGGKCVMCSHKSNNGMIFPLKKAILFIHKPILYIMYSRILAIQLQRGTDMHNSNRFLVMSVVTKDATFEFTQVPKEECPPLLAALKERGVKVPELQMPAKSMASAAARQQHEVLDDNSEDSDFVPGEDPESEEMDEDLSDVDMRSEDEDYDPGTYGTKKRKH
ncbi:unnamed protein product [Amoebophrya sp. A120]|nr:unnamed protein product [Amoebophrya sp. A120]|eukprot:GSA120T00011239001.1